MAAETSQDRDTVHIRWQNRLANIGANHKAGPSFPKEIAQNGGGDCGEGRLACRRRSFRIDMLISSDLKHTGTYLFRFMTTKSLLRIRT